MGPSWRLFPPIRTIWSIPVSGPFSSGRRTRDARQAASRDGHVRALPAVHGVHSRKRRSYGRSLIVDPWGVVLATAADGEGLALANLDFEALRQVRERLPALEHRRL